MKNFMLFRPEFIWKRSLNNYMSMSKSAAANGSRVVALDALRALAVLGVMLYHLGEFTPLFGALLPQLNWLPVIGNFGVDLFYVLSGYFIGNAVLRPAAWDPGHYVKQRLRRILPAYYVSLFVLGAGSLQHVQDLVNFLLHLTMLHTFLPWSHGSINGVYWTLGVEFPFYLLMLALAPFYRMENLRWKVCLTMIAVACLWRAGVFFSGEPSIWKRFFMASQLPGALDAFGWGCLIAALLFSSRGARLSKGYVAWGAVALGLGLTAACLMYFARHVGDYWFDLVSVVFWRTGLTGGFCLILLGLAIGGNRPLLSRIVRYSGLSFIGKISFSVYLWHMPIMLVVRKYCAEQELDLIWFGIPAMVLATLLVASASFYFVERRWHKF